METLVTGCMSLEVGSAEAALAVATRLADDLEEHTCSVVPVLHALEHLVVGVVGTTVFVGSVESFVEMLRKKKEASNADSEVVLRGS